MVFLEECDVVRNLLMRKKNGSRMSVRSVHSQSYGDYQAENQEERVVHQILTV